MDGSSLQRKGVDPSRAEFVGFRGVRGPPATPGTGKIRLEDGLSRSDGVEAGTFTEVELQVFQSASVSVRPGDGADDVALHQGDTCPCRRQLTSDDHAQSPQPAESSPGFVRQRRLEPNECG